VLLEGLLVEGVDLGRFDDSSLGGDLGGHRLECRERAPD
jgi:hypothetical protein